MRFNRMRYRHNGTGFAGSYTVSNIDPEAPGTGTVLDGLSWTQAERCLDSDHDHYDAKTGEEKWHDLWLQKITFQDTNDLPVVSGSVAGEGGYTASFSDYVINALSVTRDPFIDFVENSSIEDVYDFPVNSGNPAVAQDYDPWSFSLFGEFDPIYGHVDVSSQLSPDLVLLDRANPLRKKVNVPSALLETIKDLPSLIFNKGTTLLKSGANQNLQWEFGWKPLINDIDNLTTVAKLIDRRIEAILSLAKGKVVSRARIEKVTGTSSDSFEFPTDIGPNFGTLTGVSKRTTNLERWGCVEYAVPPEVRDELSKLSFEQSKIAAIRSLTGLYANNPAALWELLPWSWLVDWVVPFQLMLERYSNIYPLIPQRVCIMTTRSTDFVINWTLQDASMGSMGPGVIRGNHTTKERAVSNEPNHLPNVSSGKPILDLRRIGILASLIAQRRK